MFIIDCLFGSFLCFFFLPPQGGFNHHSQVMRDAARVATARRSVIGRVCFEGRGY